MHPILFHPDRLTARNWFHFFPQKLRLATIYPELYASLIMQVALAGQYRCTNGSMVRYPMNSFSNEKTGEKSNWASRLFQVTAVNIAWQNNTIRPDYLSAEKGALRYELIGDYEVLKDYSVERENGWPVYFYSGSKCTSPALDRDQDSLIDQLITGQKTVIQICAYNPRFKGSLGTFVYRSQEELQKFLEYTSTNKLPGVKFPVKFPLKITVDGGRLRSSFSQHTVYGSAVATHEVTIMYYNPSTKKVGLNNTWGAEKDWTGDHALGIEHLWFILPKPKD